MRNSKVAVLGCGLIGASWAALFATIGGCDVRAWDPSEAARDDFLRKVDRARAQLLALGATEPGTAIGNGSTAATGIATAPGTVKAYAELDAALDSVEWVQENAPEDISLKALLYRQVESFVGPDVILASSTSSFTWSQLAASLTHPERFVVAHPFNPPHLIPLVELFSPNASTLTRASEFFRGVGRVPVCLKREAIGHIGNRLSSALWREAVNIVAEGIADVGDIDKVLIHGPGLRWSIVGTHLGYHLGGGEGGIEHYLKHLGPSQERRWASLGNPTLTPQLCEQIAQGVHAEAAGRSIAELEQERDTQLIEVLRLRRAHPTIDSRQD
ncbi:MAG: 3-hydroxyacyl-CoA dehydrogenase NAD-binding domain-containing protein [Gammaproteobacteria bacterium]